MRNARIAAQTASSWQTQPRNWNDAAPQRRERRAHHREPEPRT